LRLPGVLIKKVTEKIATARATERIINGAKYLAEIV